MNTCLLQQAQTLSESLRERELRLITAESCTGGMIAALLTELPGSSDILAGGFVSYANEAKQKMLGVSASLLEAHGAVSSQVAQAMAEGALRNGLADVSIAVTGIAGPGGGSAEKPVGTVYIAAATTAPHCRVTRHLFKGNREEIRKATTKAALELVLAII